MRFRTGSANVLAFRLLSRGLTCVEILFAGPRAGYPYKLFSALLGQAERNAILRDQKCLYCDATLHHLKKFPDLASQASLAVLVGLALMMRPEISRIENRHAQLRP